jgi:outer membrane receptor for ferrienterochelin and colicins
MKIYVSLIWFFVLLNSAFAQENAGIIQGKISLSDGRPGTSMNVHLKGTKFKSVTDSDGTFQIIAPAGVYTLVYGYPIQLKQDSVLVSSGEITELVTLTINDNNINLDEVVITGQFEARSLRNSVYRVRTISSELIRLRAANNLEGVLNTELGIRFSNDLTLGESDIQLMGMSGQNVKILIDGVPLIDRGATRQSISQIDINTIERIEIVEGPMSVVYGTDALAGVINLITKKATGKDELSFTARIQEESVGNEYNSFDNKGNHNGNIGFNWENGYWQISASGTRNNFGGWTGSATGRQREWNPKDQWLANGRLAFNKGNFNGWYRLDYLNENIYNRGPINVNNFRARDQDYITDRYTHQLQTEWQINSDLSFNASASFQDYKRNTNTTILDFVTGKRELSTGQGEQDMSGFVSKFLRGTFQYRLSQKISLQPGLEINLNSGSGQRINGNPSINDYAFFLSSEILPFKGISIRPGLRFSENSVYNAPRVIPSINNKIILGNDFDLRLAYARGFRAPALRELYFMFFDASHSIQGNENLQAEYSNSFNGYLSWQSSAKSNLNFSSTFGAFYNQFNNQITTGNLPGNNNVVTYINIEKFRTQGFTIENKIRTKNLQAMFGFSYIGRFNRLSERESLPSVMWSPEVNSNLIYTLQNSGVILSLFYKYSGKRPTYQVTTNSGIQQIELTSIAGFSMADFSFNKDITKYLNLTGGVRNIFNITRIENTFSDAGAAHNTGGPVPVAYGRSYFLGMNVKLTRIN